MGEARAASPRPTPEEVLGQHATYKPPLVDRLFGGKKLVVVTGAGGRKELTFQKFGLFGGLSKASKQYEKVAAFLVEHSVASSAAIELLRRKNVSPQTMEKLDNIRRMQEQLSGKEKEILSNLNGALYTPNLDDENVCSLLKKAIKFNVAQPAQMLFDKFPEKSLQLLQNFQAKYKDDATRDLIALLQSPSAHQGSSQVRTTFEQVIRKYEAHQNIDMTSRLATMEEHARKNGNHKLANMIALGTPSRLESVPKESASTTPLQEPASRIPLEISSDPTTQFMQLCNKGNDEDAIELLGNPGTQLPNPNLLLIHAIYQGRPHVVDAFIEKRPECLNEPKKGAWMNPVEAACAPSRGGEMVKHLLRHEAFRNMLSKKNEVGNTPLAVACINNNLDAAKAILQCSEGVASLQIKNNAERIPLEIAQNRKLVAFVELFSGVTHPQ